MAALAFTGCPTDGSSSSENTVTEKNIQGIALPVFGATPVTSITPNNQFSGTVTWDPPHTAFQPRTVYKAIITLQPVGSFTLSGVPANYFDVPGAVSIRNSAGSGRIEAVFPPTGGDDNNPDIVTYLNIDQVNRPKTGIAAVKYIDNVQYSGNVSWEPGVGETFDFGKVYTATVNLTAKRGWTFAVSSTGWSIAGVSADFTNSGQGYATVKATFAVTTNDDTPISNPKITLSSLPKPGDLEGSITVRDTPEYKATIEWTNGIGTADHGRGYTPDPKEIWIGRFLAGTSDQTPGSPSGPEARISLIPKTGYTLEGVPENFFYIDGIEPWKDADGKQTGPSNNADRGVVSYKFPKMDMVVRRQNILGVDPPRTGASYSAVVINNNPEYTGTVTWNPPIPTNPSNQFASRTQYTATINMTPRPGYTFYGVPENFFIMQGAFLVTNALHGNVVTVKFPTTAPKDGEDLVTVDGLYINLPGYNVDATPPAYLTIGLQNWDQVIYDDSTTVGLRFVPADGKFIAGKSYTAYFAVKAKDGFTLEGVEANSFKVVVNDQEDGIVRATEHGANSGVITVNLGPVPRKKVSAPPAIGNVTSAAIIAEIQTRITAMTRPEQGQPGNNKSVFVLGTTKEAVTQTKYFEQDGTIVWDPPLLTSGTFRNNFEPNTQYKAIIKLKDSSDGVYQLDDGMDPGFFIPSTFVNNSNIQTAVGTFIPYYADAATGGDYLSGEGVQPVKLVRPVLVGNDWSNSQSKPNPYYDKANKTLTLQFTRTEALVVGKNGAVGDAHELVINLKEPATGAEPQRTVSSDYFTGSVAWTTENGLPAGFDANGRFMPKVTYVAIVAMKPTAYYKFSRDRTFTINGLTNPTGVTVNVINDPNNPANPSLSTQQAYVKVAFNRTKEKIPETIKLDTLPVTGVSPSLGVAFTPIETTETGLQFGTVVWTQTGSKPTNTLKDLFGSNLVYTAKFTLFLGSGYSLRGIDPAGYFKLVDAEGSPVEGVDLTYDVSDPDARQLAITAVFPPTRASLNFLSGAEKKAAQQIPKAKSGKSYHPDNSAEVIRGTDVIDGTYYTGSIVWKKKDLRGDASYTDFIDPRDEGKFGTAGEQYQATITLKAKAPYTFAGVPAGDTTNAALAVWFNLEGGKLDKTAVLSTHVNAKSVGTYWKITSDTFVPLSTVDYVYKEEKDFVKVTVDYLEIQKTIDTDAKKITHGGLFSNGAPTDVGDSANPGSGLNSNANSGLQYKITKAIGWSDNALSNNKTGNFKSNWTFTGTYTVAEIPPYTFKGIDNFRDLFQTDGVYLADVQNTTTSGNAVVKTILVGYSTRRLPGTPGPETIAVTNNIATPVVGSTLSSASITVPTVDFIVTPSAGFTLTSLTWVNASGADLSPGSWSGTTAYLKVVVTKGATWDFEDPERRVSVATTQVPALLALSVISGNTYTFFIDYTLTQPGPINYINITDEVPAPAGGDAYSSPGTVSTGITVDRTGVNSTPTSMEWRRYTNDKEVDTTTFVAGTWYYLKVVVTAEAGDWKFVEPVTVNGVTVAVPAAVSGAGDKTLTFYIAKRATTPEMRSAITVNVNGVTSLPTNTLGAQNKSVAGSILVSPSSTYLEVTEPAAATDYWLKAAADDGSEVYGSSDKFIGGTPTYVKVVVEATQGWSFDFVNGVTVDISPPSTRWRVSPDFEPLVLVPSAGTSTLTFYLEYNVPKSNPLAGTDVVNISSLKPAVGSIPAVNTLSNPVSTAYTVTNIAWTVDTGNSFGGTATAGDPFDTTTVDKQYRSAITLTIGSAYTFKDMTEAAIKALLSNVTQDTDYTTMSVTSPTNIPPTGLTTEPTTVVVTIDWVKSISTFNPSLTANKLDILSLKPNGNNDVPIPQVSSLTVPSVYSVAIAWSFSTDNFASFTSVVPDGSSIVFDTSTSDKQYKSVITLSKKAGTSFNNLTVAQIKGLLNGVPNANPGDDYQSLVVTTPDETNASNFPVTGNPDDIVITIIWNKNP